MLRVVTSFFDRQPPALIASTGFILLLGVAALDHLTGYELSFSIFYLLPILLIAWYQPAWLRYAFCLCAAALWLAVDHTSGSHYSSPFIPYWNTAVRLGFFLITSTLLAQLKGHLQLEKTLAKTDALTGISNARAFKEQSGSLLELAVRHKRSLALGYIDVDDFKTVNDTLGHSEGDRVLKAVASALARCARGTDVVGRLGGDEFAVFLPETDLQGAQVVFGRMREELLRTAADGGWPIGFSMGAAIFAAAPATIDEALRQADALMYRVKKGGKNNLAYELVA